MEIKQQVTKYCGKEEKLLSSFPQYFEYVFQESNYIFILLNVVVRFNCFPQFHKFDMSRYGSKCFRGFLGLRDNECRL